MVKYYALAVTTKYWKPRQDYLKEITNSIASRVENGDFVVVSEKAVSTALGNIVDESLIHPSLNAKLIAKPWMRFMWGYFTRRAVPFRKAFAAETASVPHRRR